MKSENVKGRDAENTGGHGPATLFDQTEVNPRRQAAFLNICMLIIFSKAKLLCRNGVLGLLSKEICYCTCIVS